MSFRPAIASTTASSRRSVTSASRRTPNSEPTMPPTTTAPTHSGAALGSACTLMVSPKRPAIELTRIKAVETLVLWRGSAHPLTRRSGPKKMPPPIPVSPVYWASSVRVYVPAPIKEVTTTSTAMSPPPTSKKTAQTSGTTLMPQSRISCPVSASKNRISKSTPEL
jgi:hypothetical protein